MEILRVLDVWQLLGGLGMFLFGMYLLESGIKKLSDKGLRRMIHGATSYRLTSIATGALATGIVQSSSAVSLLVLAFVGAGYMSTLSAFGVIMGSNLGTTLNSWVVALVGFKLNIEEIALPFLAIGGLLFVLKGRSRSINQLSKLFAGLGLLFLGIAFMKESVDDLASTVDLSDIPQYGNTFYVVFGALITAAMQASAATIVLVLTAVDADIINLNTGVAIVIGSNIGTTITVLLGAFGGGYAKQRVAISHLVFNVVTAVVALVILPYMLIFIQKTMGIGDNPVIAIAVFHTLFNLLGIIIFFPLMKKWSGFLERHIVEKHKVIGPLFLSVATPRVVEAALQSIQKESLHLLMESFLFNLMIFDLKEEDVFEEQTAYGPYLRSRLSVKERYQSLKELGDEIFAFAAKVRDEEMAEVDAFALDRYLHAVRSFLNASKNLKDVRRNLSVLRDSDSLILQNAYAWFRDFLVDFMASVQSAVVPDKTEDLGEEIGAMRDQIEAFDKEFVLDKLHALSGLEIEKHVITDALMANRYFCNALLLSLEGLEELLLERWSVEEEEGSPGSGIV
jgi:phosphate:Na+ symporter